MISVPAVERRCDVHRTVHEGCVQGKCERKVSKRNVAKRERECEWIERAGGEATQKRHCNHQAVSVHQWQKYKQYGEERGGSQHYSPRPHQTTEIHRERADKHQADIEGSANPRAFVIPKSMEAPEIGQAEGDHATG